MFRRKDEMTDDANTESNTSSENNSSESSSAPAAANSNRSFARPAALDSLRASASTPTAGQAALSPFRPSAVVEQPRARQPEAPRAAAPMASAAAPSYAPATAPEKSAKANRRVLTVGNDILMKGEITNCDRFVIEGQVDAKVSSVHTMELAESGSFKGIAEVEEAEISGVLEGELVVRGRLVIYSTGKVRGKLTYGEIEIERGGEITGEVKTMASAGAGASSSSSSRSSSRSDERQKKLLDTVAA